MVVAIGYRTKSARVEIRMTKEDRARIRAAAKRAGVKPSAWIRDTLVREAAKAIARAK